MRMVHPMTPNCSFLWSGSFGWLKSSAMIWTLAYDANFPLKDLLPAPESCIYLAFLKAQFLFQACMPNFNTSFWYWALCSQCPSQIIFPSTTTLFQYRIHIMDTLSRFFERSLTIYSGECGASESDLATRDYNSNHNGFRTMRLFSKIFLIFDRQLGVSSRAGASSRWNDYKQRKCLSLKGWERGSEFARWRPFLGVCKNTIYVRSIFVVSWLEKRKKLLVATLPSTYYSKSCW